ncbi:MAG: hypothetical protein OEM67_08045 [Thermoleophilia bacterium]|nr:hypothetical protein [Thermoleophilia bacterium]MDH3725165.1 hypothetical protein [Thermoleophilia bacterium]
MADTDRQPETFPEAKLANEFARRLIAGHPPEWRPYRRVPSAIQPIERALEEGSITPTQARRLLADVWQEVSGRPLPIDADSDELFTELASSLSRVEARTLRLRRPHGRRDVA